MELSFAKPKLSSLTPQMDEVKNICSLKDQTTIAEDMTGHQGQNKFTAEQDHTTGSIRNAYVSGTPIKYNIPKGDSYSVHLMSGAVRILKQPTDDDGDSASTMVDNPKYAALAGSSPLCVEKWNYQSPNETSSTRHMNTAYPVPNNDESPIPSLGSTTYGPSSRSSFGAAQLSLLKRSLENSCPIMKTKLVTALTSSGLSGAEESQDAENKLTGNCAGTISATFSADCEGGLSLSPSEKISYVKAASTDGVVGQGMILSSKMPVLSGVKEVENLHSAQPPTCARLGSDKDKCKSIRAPPKRLRVSHSSIRAGHHLNYKPLTETGEFEHDHEQLLIAARSVHTARELACSNPFWKKMECFFASVTAEDLQLLKLRCAEVLNQNQSQMLNGEHDALCVVMQNCPRGEQRPLDHGSVGSAASFGGLVTGSSPDVVPALFQRVLSALIDEDGGKGEDLHDQNGERSVPFQCTSNNTHCGSSSYADSVCNKGGNVESKADLPSQMYFLKGRISSNQSAPSITDSSQIMFSSVSSINDWQADDGLLYSNMGFFHDNDQKDLAAMHSSQGGQHSVSSFNRQYQMLSPDRRMLLELNRIGLYPEKLPQLEDKEEWIDREIKELQENLYQQEAKGKKVLDKIDKAIQHEQYLEKRNIEEAAMNQLIQMAYKRMENLGSKSTRGRSKSTRNNARKIAKEAALAFVERTLVRCKQFEDTGRSCFSEPNLQDVMLSAPLCEQDVKLIPSNDSKRGSICSEAYKKSEPNYSGEKKDTLINQIAGGASSKVTEVMKITAPGGLQPSFSDAGQAITHSSKPFVGPYMTFSEGKRKVIDEIVSGAPSKVRQVIRSQEGLGGNRDVSSRDLERGLTTINSASGTHSLLVDRAGTSNRYNAKSKQKILSGHQEHSAQPSAAKSGNPMAIFNYKLGGVQEFRPPPNISQNLPK